MGPASCHFREGPRKIRFEDRSADNFLYNPRSKMSTSNVSMDTLYDKEDNDPCPAFYSRRPITDVRSGNGFQIRWAASADLLAMASTSIFSPNLATFSGSALVIGPTGTMVHPSVGLIDMS